jgi:asparagine synthase (glutamine-hydrolysing)
MNDRLRHRGPDDAGIYLDDRAGLAMRRLSIVDLATGHQPIANEDQTIWIVFNGEIYNHLGLRQRLEAKGHRFATKQTPKPSCTAMKRMAMKWSTTSTACSPSPSGTRAANACSWPATGWASNRSTITAARSASSSLRTQGALAHPDVPRELDFTALDQFPDAGIHPQPTLHFPEIFISCRRTSVDLENGREPRLEQYWNVTFQPTA